MAKRLKITKNKTSESFYVIDDFTDPKTKKRSTFIVERLGNLAFLMDKYHTDSRDVVLSKLKEYIAELREKDKAESAEVTLTLQPAQDIPKDEERLFNIGYLYIRNIMTSLGIKKICEEIKDRSKFQFDLFNILCDLVCTRIIFPGSKRSSFHDASHFFHDQTYQLEDVYRALPVLAREKYFIEKELYKNSSNLYDRNTAILYYDCTNFYFEMEDETDFIKYGKCKENRPNPIVQYGLFMDTDGIPMSDITFEGNKNEQFSLRELEMRIMNDFKLSRFVVCADAGLNGIENKIFNDKKNEGAYIVTQPIKKLNKKLKAWATDKTTGWRLEGHEGTFNISELAEYVEINGKTYRSKDLVFYKDVWTKTKRKTEQFENTYTLNEHLIVTYSPKYKEYQEYIRNKKIERAMKLLDNPGKLTKKNQRDPRYYIDEVATTENGEVAEEKIYTINEEKIKEEQKYDGFYCVATDLKDTDLPMVIRANKGRWEIEESFQIMKSELKTRPMYVTTEDAISGHLLTCFIALLVYRVLEKKYLKEEYTCREIMKTLRDMNITHVKGSTYIPSFKRTNLTDELGETFGFNAAREVITQKQIKKFERIVNSKKSTKLKSK